MEEINLFDLKSRHEKEGYARVRSRRAQRKGFENVFITLQVCFIANVSLYLLFLSEPLLIPSCILMLAAKLPTILYLFILLQQAVVPRCAHRSCFCSVIVRCSTHNCIMEKQPPTKSKQDKPMTPA